ncbi:MAG TPA: histidinol-phosphate transaminase [Candidatus Dormibacteraeota bacterium]|nr:histidinol-phosphate transaminase [Candidatus Dormibacteraeota bacterium]
MSTLRRASLGEGFGYTPGEQPPDRDGWLKLNTNEAPLAPSSAVAPAIAAASALLHLYPDPYGEPLRSALARHHGVGTESVFVANGADQVIDCLFRAYCEPGDRAVWPVPTYSLFPVLARLFGVETLEIPLGADLGLPAAVGTADGRLRFVVNPNAPTGVWTTPDMLEELLDPAPGVVAIDEAYCDFAPASCLPLLERHPRWLVLRTFSKGYALAGLRVGYAVGHPELIADLLAVKDSYPVDRCALAGAAAALADQEHHRRLVAGVRAERARLTARLVAAGWTLTPSEANFVFARPAGGEAPAVLARLREQRILVRHFTGEHADRLRITVGTPEQNDRLLAALGV